MKIENQLVRDSIHALRLVIIQEINKSDKSFEGIAIKTGADVKCVKALVTNGGGVVRVQSVVELLRHYTKNWQELAAVLSVWQKSCGGKKIVLNNLLEGGINKACE